MRHLVLALALCSGAAHATHLKDLEVLDVSVEERNEFQFKVRSRATRIESYFYLAFEKNNPQNMDQLGFVLQKLVQGDRYKLDAEIPSFSAYPSGSFYNVSDIRFSSPSQRRPNHVDEKSKPAPAPKAK